MLTVYSVEAAQLVGNFGSVLVGNIKIAERGDVLLGITTGSMSPEIIQLCSGNSGYSFCSGGHCEMDRGEQHLARNLVRVLILCSQGKLHCRKLGAQLEELSRNWSRWQVNCLHMVSSVVLFQYGSDIEPPVLVPLLKIRFVVVYGLFGHWFVAPFTSDGVE